MRSRRFALANTMAALALACPLTTWAAVGDLLETVNLPDAAKCTGSEEIGTSMAIVPGALVSKSQYQTLLVTSCFGDPPAAATLNFLDPSTDPATLVQTISTSVTPPKGWGALSLRGDKGDLIGCGNAEDGTHSVYAIDVSGFRVAAGTATLLFNATPGAEICDGLAWDTADNTIFQSPDVWDTIYHFDETGTLLGSFPTPAGCNNPVGGTLSNSGLAVGGASLFASCNGDLEIFQLNKSTGATFTSFTTGGQRTEDLECDPVRFAAMNKDAMWSKDAFTNQAFAFEIPVGTCGFAGGPPVVPAACPDGSTTDSDGDGLFDCWETNGIDFDGDGTVDLQLYDVDKNGTIEVTERADPQHKDLYLEIDWMAQHQPVANALTDVITSFANAATVANPDGTTGVRLHLQSDEQAVAHNNSLAFEPCTLAAPAGTPDFDVVKLASFGTAAERTSANSVNVLNAKRFAVRYMLVVHNLLGTTSSGCAELPGNDFVMSLGSFGVVGGHNVGTRDQQAGTLMHELGHTLNLHHGGNDDFNCKPNYLSVMTYTRQLDNTPIMGRPLDYSTAALAALDETNLSEPAGVGAGAGAQTAFGPDPVMVAAANGAIDWDRDGAATGLMRMVNVNMVAGAGCGGAGTTLNGFDDWRNLQYNHRASFDFADGVHLTVLQAPEMTADQALSMSPGSDVRCYRARTRPGTPRFARREVHLADQFQTVATVIRDPDGFCTPVDQNGDGITDPTNHLTCYEARGVHGEAAFTARDIVVHNQFGDATLTLVAPKKTVCVPSAKDGVPVASQPDTFTCYKARNDRTGFASRAVELGDAFETASGTVVRAESLCVPTDVDGAGIRHPQAALACYRLRNVSGSPTLAPLDFTATNLFGDQSLTLLLKKSSPSEGTICVLSRIDT